MALRMTFGGSPCPSLWGYISDTLADSCNSLIHNIHWDHISLLDPLSELLDLPKALPDSVPYHKALPLSVGVPRNDLGKVDIYLDDIQGKNQCTIF